MKHEKSCGIIPIKYENDQIFVLLIKQNNGVIGFPKGHVEKGESEEETAIRECFEETNIKTKIVPNFRDSIEYFMKELNAWKTVVFFIGEINDSSFKRQESEISDIFLVKIEESFKMITFEDTRKLLKKAHNFIKNNQ